MIHAKTLFFIHNQKAEIAKLHILGQDAMRADQQVDLAILQPLNDFLLFFWAAETAEHGPHRFHLE